MHGYSSELVEGCSIQQSVLHSLYALPQSQSHNIPGHIGTRPRSRTDSATRCYYLHCPINRGLLGSVPRLRHISNTFGRYYNTPKRDQSRTRRLHRSALHRPASFHNYNVGSGETPRHLHRPCRNWNCSLHRRARSSLRECSPRLFVFCS